MYDKQALIELVREKSLEFGDFTLMMMYSEFLKCKVKENAQGYMRLLPGTRFGPVEKTYYAESDITSYPGAVAYNYGQGKTVFIQTLALALSQSHMKVLILDTNFTNNELTRSMNGSDALEDIVESEKLSYKNVISLHKRLTF